MPKLFVPVRISTGRGGRAIRGTSAFALEGTKISPDLRVRLREVDKKIRELRGIKKKRGYVSGMMDYLEMHDRLVHAIANERKNIAHESDFFMKQVTPAQKAIRTALLAKGVPLEVPMMGLGNGKELFAREKGFGPVPQHPKNPTQIKSSIRNILRLMHQANVTHNHFHLGNFVMDAAERNVKLLDLSKAKLYRSPPKNKAEFLRRYSSDIFFCAKNLAHLGEYYSLPSENRRLSDAIDNEISLALSSYGQSFGITPKEVFDAFLAIENKGFLQRRKLKKK
ncbi:MAG: hypothetical protein AABW59_04235 [archaeon]